MRTASVLETRLSAASLAPKRFTDAGKVRSSVVGPCRVCRLLRGGDAFAARRSRGHPRCDLGRFGPREVFGGVFGRQDLDHLLVLDPHLDHVKRAAIAVKAVPTFALGDAFNFGRIGGDAQREMCRGKLARLFSDKAAADLATRAQFGPRRVDLDTRTEVVELKREMAAGIGRKRHRCAAHDFGQNCGHVLRVACSDRQMMDHGSLASLLAINSTAGAPARHRPETAYARMKPGSGVNNSCACATPR